jgi:hypothetical protein
MSSEDFSARCRYGGVISYVNTLKCLISLYQEAPSEICSDYKPRRDVDSSPHEGLYLLTLFKAFLVQNSVCLPHLSIGFSPTRDGVDAIKEILVQDVVGCITGVVSYGLLLHSASPNSLLDTQPCASQNSIHMFGNLM